MDIKEIKAAAENLKPIYMDEVELQRLRHEALNDSLYDEERINGILNESYLDSIKIKALREQAKGNPKGEKNVSTIDNIISYLNRTKVWIIRLEFQAKIIRDNHLKLIQILTF